MLVTLTTTSFGCRVALCGRWRIIADAIGCGWSMHHTKGGRWFCCKPEDRAPDHVRDTMLRALGLNGRQPRQERVWMGHEGVLTGQDGKWVVEDGVSVPGPTRRIRA